MKRSNRPLILIFVLALVLVGFYAIDYDTDNATVGSLPPLELAEDETADSESNPDAEINTLNDLNDAIVNITQKTNPAVVTVFTTQTYEVPNNPLFRFFGQPEGDGDREFRRQGLGSGVIVSDNGYILTNNHVIEGAEEVRVRTLDGKELDAQIVGTDPQTDIGVLKVDGGDLPSIKIGNSDQLRVGEFVLAIGSPFGDNFNSVSFGIVSGKGRSIGLAQRTGGYEDFIQTDAAINPGNSGGALINLDGELVGINTAIATRSGGNQGVGYAVPSNLAQNIMKQLIETGEVQRGYLGITHGGDVDRTMAKALDLDETYGVIVGEVQDGEAADEAGLKEGDVILSLNGEPIEDWISFRTDIASHQPGEEVTLGISRDGKKMEITVELGALPTNQQASVGRPDEDLEEQLGFSVRNLTPEIARQLQIEPGTEGVVVTEVKRGSSAHRQGLQQGDVIVSVARENITNVSEFNEVMSQLAQEGEQVVLLRILRQGNGMFIAFEL